MLTSVVSDRPGPLLATGGSAHVHAWGERHVLKLYLAGAPVDLPAAEAARTNAARAAGAPAPLALDTVTIAGRHGAVFERIDGPTMLDALLARPQALDAYAAELAALQVAVHRLAGDALPRLSERMHDRIARCAALTGSQRARVAQLIDRLSPGAALCHGDFHPGNVILAAHGPVIIDWYDAASGPPDADFARTLLLLRHASIPGPPSAAIDRVRAAFHDAYAAHYRALRPVDPASLDAWTLVVAAARLTEARTQVEQDQLREILERGLRT